MILRNKSEIDKFVKKHQTAKKSIYLWLFYIEQNDWKSLEELKSDFSPSAEKLRIDMLPRIIFKLGKKIRIDTYINFSKSHIIINRIGTHEEYNKWKY